MKSQDKRPAPMAGGKKKEKAGPAPFTQNRKKTRTSLSSRCKARTVKTRPGRPFSCLSSGKGRTSRRLPSPRKNISNPAEAPTPSEVPAAGGLFYSIPRGNRRSPSLFPAGGRAAHAGQTFGFSRAGYISNTGESACRMER